MSGAAHHMPALWQAFRSRTETKEFPDWSRFISDWLEAAGWPGDAELTQQEEKLIELWNNALSELAALGLVSPAVTFESALSHLRRLLSKSVEPGDWSSPVQVLEASEAAGVGFESAIVVGLSEESWPPRQSLSPLIPLALQRAHGVPGSTTAGAQHERERLTAALFRESDTTHRRDLFSSSCASCQTVCAARISRSGNLDWATPSPVLSQSFS